MKKFLTRGWFPRNSVFRMSTTVLAGVSTVSLIMAFAPGVMWGGPSTERFELVYPIFKMIDGFPFMAYTAVLDNETGLVWERAPGDLNGDKNVDTTGESEDRVTWEGAHEACILKTIGGRSGWKLPSLSQLQSLYDLNNPDPLTQALPVGHPFLKVISNVKLAGYWTATTYVSDPDLAWVIGFPKGSGTPVSKGGPLFTWCVRGTSWPPWFGSKGPALPFE